MKKIFTFLSILYCFAAAPAAAQGIYQLWGSTPGGGPDNAGVIFSSRFDGSGFKVQEPFTISTPGAAAPGNKLIQYDNKFYALLAYGGSGGTGMIGEYNQNGTWTRKADLFTIKAGSYETGGLMVFNNKIYGLCGSGGLHGEGVLFEFTPFNGGITVLHHFSGASGGYPQGYLTAYNNKLYGSTSSGGAQDEGVIFEFDPASNIYTKKADYNPATLGYIPGDAFTLYNGRLWGVTKFGALNNGGALFSFDPATSIISKKFNFSDIDMGRPCGSLTILNNRLYGASTSGGNVGFGGIFEYNPATDQEAVEYFFASGDPHLNVHLTAYLGKLYGSALTGAAFNDGGIFSYDPAGNIFQQMFSFQNSSGTRGTGYLMMNNNTLYGLTTDEGNFGSGTLFAFSHVNAQLQTLVHFGDARLKTPEGPLLYYNHKFYGTATTGGNYRDGGIFEYDPATGVNSMKVSFNSTVTGQPGTQGGFTLFNNKFYLVTRRGGSANSGTLLEYDPATNLLTKRHDFVPASGTQPYAQLTVLNGKLYGTCSQGSGNGNGNIFEYDPLTQLYSQKVVLDASTGVGPKGRMTVYNNRLYGVADAGGSNNQGTVFEYNPAGNIFTKRADFTATSGARPWGGLTVWGNQLYGTTTYGGAADSGSIYQFDPVSSALTKRADLDYTSGTRPVNRLTSINNKLYGMMNFGGSEDQGTLIEFNPATGLLLKKKDFTKPDAGRPVTNELLAIPAPVAPGSPNSCINSQTVNINAANANEWIAFTDTEGRAVAEINANGNILGNTTVRFYVNSGPARKTGEGNYYLDRNISITRANQPLTPVSIRLYIRKKEFDDLKATPGTNLQLPSDLSVFSNSDACSPIMNSAALPVISTQENWGTDYVYSASVMNLNSFYFAKTGTVLPVQLLSFTGKREACNLLTWKASCTQETLFDLEKSTDGQQFSSIYNVQASTQDCNQAFTYNDCHAGSGKTFYRLRMQETGGPVLYSPQVVLKGDETAPGIIRLLNNPVQGSTAQLQISGKENTAALLTLTDMAGKKLWTKQLTAQPGTQTIALDVSAFTAGMYYLVYDDDRERKVVKMMRQ